MKEIPLKIPLARIPRGVYLSIRNSERHQKDALILAEQNKFQNSIVLLIIAIEEFGKALWLMHHFMNEKDVDEPDKWQSTFYRHNKKIDLFFEFVKNIPGYTKKSGTNQFVNMTQIIKDEQEYKLRMMYVDYSEEKKDPYWDDDVWKDPTFIWQLAFIEENESIIALKTKIDELNEDLKQGLGYFKNTQWYLALEKFVNKTEKPNIKSVARFLHNHFLLEKIQSSVGVGKGGIEVTLQPRNQSWVDSSLASVIKNELKKKYEFYNVKVDIIPKN